MFSGKEDAMDFPIANGQPPKHACEQHHTGSLVLIMILAWAKISMVQAIFSGLGKNLLLSIFFKCLDNHSNTTSNKIFIFSLLMSHFFFIETFVIYNRRLNNVNKTVYCRYHVVSSEKY